MEISQVTELDLKHYHSIGANVEHCRSCGLGLPKLSIKNLTNQVQNYLSIKP